MVVFLEEKCQYKLELGEQDYTGKIRFKESEHLI